MDHTTSCAPASRMAIEIWKGRDPADFASISPLET